MKLAPQQIEEIKARNSCEQWARRWVRLRKKGDHWIGPCPFHSQDPQAKDSTSFEVWPDKWLCATCTDGGDVIALVQKHENCDFNRAVELLGGATPAPQDPAEVARAEAASKKRQAERAAEAKAYRERERERARALAKFGKPIAGSPGEIYLRDKRGVDFPPDVRLRCDLNARFYIPGDKREDPPKLIHTGPALLAGIMIGKEFVGLHSTYIDLNEPKGKAKLADPQTGEELDPKKVRGSKKGGRIELITVKDPHTVVIGEGLEKVLGVWTSYKIHNRALEGIAWWTSGDLGNLGGKAAETVAHPFLKGPKGRPQRVGNAVPDLEAPAIEIPDSVTRIVILGDSTSDRFATQLVVARAAARWARPGREILCAWSPDGEDFDDPLCAAGGDLEARAAAAARILAIVDKAAPPAVPDAVVFSAPVSPAPPESAGSQKGGPVESAGRGSQGGQKPPPAAPREDPHELNRRLAFLPQTDLGNAERFRERNRDQLLFVPTLPGAGNSGGWLWWDKTRWSAAGADAEVKRAEHRCVRAIQDEAKAIDGDAKRIKVAKKKKDEAEEADAGEEKRAGRKRMLTKLGAALRSWGRKSEANSKMVPISRHAGAYLEVDINALDADRFAFNVRNGTLVFRREWDSAKDPSIEGHERWLRHGDFIKFKPHDPRDLITRVAPVDYKPGAACPLFEAFLNEVQPEPSMRSFLQVWKGYQLTGDTGEARVAIFLGGGRNGKGVFETATNYALGDYAGATQIETFMMEARSRSSGQPTPELAKLPGIRALRASEPKKGARLDEALIKQVTGGDPVDARHLNRGFFTFLPQFKLTISANHKTKITGTDEGIWSRVTLVPFEVFIPEERRDPKLGDKMQAEASGLLNWMLDGLSRWMEEGLKLPGKVKDATAEYRRSSDQLGRFLELCTAADPEGRVQSSHLLEVHNAWARAGGGAEWRPQGFSGAMEDRGFKSTKSSVIFWLGLKLTKDVHDFVDSGGRPRTGEAAADDHPGRAEVEEFS